MTTTLAEVRAHLLRIEGLSELTMYGSTNRHGLSTAWVELPAPKDLPSVGAELLALGARLATTTVYLTKPVGHVVAYHFVVDDLPLTVKVPVSESDSVPSITSLFANADWEEREIMELSGLTVTGHPNPRRLFLDESIEAGVLDRYVPMSEMTNLAQQDELWNRIRQAQASVPHGELDREGNDR